MSASFLINKTWVQLMLPTIEVLINFIGVQRTILLVCKPDSFKRIDDNDDLSNAKGVLRSLKLGVEQTFWKGNCLSRSIVLHRLLIKNGISSRLCIGVRNKPKFKAHAWVEHKNIPLNAGKRVHKNYQMVENYNFVQKANFS
jgi:hypothetical protein